MFSYKTIVKTTRRGFRRRQSNIRKTTYRKRQKNIDYKNVIKYNFISKYYIMLSAASSPPLIISDGPGTHAGEQNSERVTWEYLYNNTLLDKELAIIYFCILVNGFNENTNNIVEATKIRLTDRARTKLGQEKEDLEKIINDLTSFNSDGTNYNLKDPGSIYWFLKYNALHCFAYVLYHDYIDKRTNVARPRLKHLQNITFDPLVAPGWALCLCEHHHNIPSRFNKEFNFYVMTLIAEALAITYINNRGLVIDIPEDVVRRTNEFLSIANNMLGQAIEFAGRIADERNGDLNTYSRIFQDLLDNIHDHNSILRSDERSDEL